MGWVVSHTSQVSCKKSLIQRNYVCDAGSSPSLVPAGAAAAVVAAALLVMVAGCGGGGRRGDDSST